MKDVNKINIFNTTVDVEPTGVIYTFTPEMVSDFITSTLRRRGVDKILDSVVKIVQTGKDHPRVAMYVFIDPNSNMISSNVSNNIAPAIRNKMHVPLRITNEFKNILAPLCGDGDIDMGKDKGTCWIKLDPFHVFGLMLAAIPSEHNIVIMSASRQGKSNGIIKVAKQYHPNTKSTSEKGNKYSNMVDNLVRHERF